MYDWVKDIFDCSPVECNKISLQDAECDLSNFKADGWELPDDFTPEEYQRLWNMFVDRQEKDNR